jgi:CheY-like chemotaxis protein
VVLCDGAGTLHDEFARCSDKVEFVDTRDLAQAAQVLRECPAHAVVLSATNPNDLWSLVEAVRGQKLGTPIIGCCVPRPASQAVAVGALGHLVKPVTRADLEEAIQAVGKPVRRILVVDDDPDFVRLLTRMLDACDGTLAIEATCSGQQALDNLRRTPPDLMLLDIVMPDMDGWQVLEAMRQDDSTRAVPTFLVSALDPADQPPNSEFLLATMDRGLPLGKVLSCSLQTADSLLQPEGEIGPVPV